MPVLFLYLLKVNATLVLFYIAYLFLLRPLTFYSLNRIFLVFGIIFSLIYPFIDVSRVLRQHQELNGRFAAIAPAWRSVLLMPGHTQLSTFWQVITVIFWVGAVLMALRFFGQLFSLYRIHRKSNTRSYGGFRYRQANALINPFSFWQAVYLNPGQHRQDELTFILRHEYIHVRQWHTLDVLLGELNFILCWFNPAAWLLKQAVKENLEFFTDRKMLQSGVNSQAYQYSLVRISSFSQGAALVNNFNFLTTKKRVAMMNKKRSPLMLVTRYAVLIPLIVAPLLAFTACNEEPTATSPIIVRKQANVQIKTPDAVVYYIDGKEVILDAVENLDPKKIQSINVYKGESAIKAFKDKGGNGIVEITTRKN